MGIGCKVTFFWESSPLRDYGWSESYYTNYTTIPDAQAAAARLLNKLRPIKGRQTLWVGTRTASLDANGFPTRLSLIDEPTFNPSENFDVPTSWTSDYPNISLDLRVVRNDGHKNTQFCRGIPDGVFQFGTSPGSTLAGWLDRYNAFETYLNGGSDSWQMRALSGAIVYKNITGINTSTGEVTCPANGFADGDKVTMKGFHGPDAWYYNKTWKIFAPGANAFFLSGFNAAAFPNVQYAGAKAYKPLYSLSNGVWSMLRVSDRRAGRPFGSTTGRRRTRR